MVAITILAAGVAAGCGVDSKGPGAYTPPTAPPTTASATGNWEITFTATSGDSLFPTLSGYIKDDESDSPPTPFTTAEMTANASSGCFIGRNSIFLYGDVSGAQLPLHSDSVNGQFLSFTGTLNAKATTMSGTYSVTGGCADGATGTISGEEISPVSGTYSGSDEGGTLQLQLTQNPYGNGNGYFEFSGSAAVSGISCFNTGKIVTASSLITGNSLLLTLSTSDPTGAELILQGTVDPAGSTITLSSIKVTAGNCAGSYGTATLNLQ